MNNGINPMKKVHLSRRREIDYKSLRIGSIFPFFFFFFIYMQQYSIDISIGISLPIYRIFVFRIDNNIDIVKKKKNGIDETVKRRCNYSIYDRNKIFSNDMKNIEIGLIYTQRKVFSIFGINRSYFSFLRIYTLNYIYMIICVILRSYYTKLSL